MNKAEIEKYKMLISTMSEDKAEKAIKMLKNRKNTKDDILQFITENADVYIVKDPDEIKDKDLTGYGAVMFDCYMDVEFPYFSNCPKKMIFNKDISGRHNVLEKLPDLSESVVLGYVNIFSSYYLKTLEGSPKYVGDFFGCGSSPCLTSLKGAPKYVGNILICDNCENLTSAEVMPEEIGYIVDCKDTPLDESLGGSGLYLTKNGKLYDLFNLPKDEEFVIDGDLTLRGMGLKELPDLSNVIVKGNFDCNDNPITSLKGAPKEVGGDFDCRYCDNLTSLEGAPKEVGGDFDCNGCENLTSLEGAPAKVGGEFRCWNCKKLTSADGLPKEIGGVIDFSHTPLAESLGASGVYIKRDGELYDIFNLPKDKEFVINGDLILSGMDLKELPDLSNVIVKGSFYCCNNPITSLKRAPKKVAGNFDCKYCENLTSADGLPKEIGGEIICDDQMRPIFDKELKRRKNVSEASIFFMKKFGNGGM